MVCHLDVILFEWRVFVILQNICYFLLLDTCWGFFFNLPSLKVYLQLCILVFEQHNDCPCFLSAGRGPCCRLVLLLDLLAGSATPNSRLIKEPLTWLWKKALLPDTHCTTICPLTTGSPWSQCDLACTHHMDWPAFITITPALWSCACCEYSHHLGRSMKGFWINSVCIGPSIEASFLSYSSPADLPLISSDVS